MNPIGWCGETWVPYVGCDKVSPGCEECYAIRMSWRLSHNPKTKHIYAGTVKKTAGGKLNWTGDIKENIPQLDKPLRTKKPTIFFINSMSDVFHKALTNEMIDDIFQVMDMCPRHIFQVLTKRHEEMLRYYQWKQSGNGHQYNEWPLKNVWIGVSVENQKYADIRIPFLLQIPAEVRFLSCEPLLGKIDFTFMDFPVGMKWKLTNYLTGALTDMDGNTEYRSHVNWVICGAESGPGAKPMHWGWVDFIRRQCKDAEVPFYFKQWGEFVPETSPPINSKKDYTVLFNGDHAPINDLSFRNKYTEEEWMRQVPSIMCKVGKHKSGKELDGKEYLQFPKQIGLGGGTAFSARKTGDAGMSENGQS